MDDVDDNLDMMDDMDDVDNLDMVTSIYHFFQPSMVLWLDIDAILPRTNRSVR